MRGNNLSIILGIIVLITTIFQTRLYASSFLHEKDDLLCHTINDTFPEILPIDDIEIGIFINHSIIVHTNDADSIYGIDLPDFVEITQVETNEAIINIVTEDQHIGEHNITIAASNGLGIATSDFMVTVSYNDVYPTPVQDGPCNLLNIKLESSSPGFENLFDEFWEAGDPASSPGGNPQNAWIPSFDIADYPAIGYIELESQVQLTRIFLRDVNGSGAFKIYSGTSPSSMDTVPLIIDSLGGFGVWNEHSLEVNTKYLFFEMETPFSRVGEVLIFGVCDFLMDTIPPSPIVDLTIDTIDRNNAIISWSPSGDDFHKGNSTSYDFRFSNTPITDSLFETLPSQMIHNVQPSDTVVQMELEKLDCELPHYFAVKAIDEIGNVSSISNIASDSTFECHPFISITVTFDSILQDTPQVDFTPLRFDKDFAYSFTFDDGSVWEYDVSYKILGGGVTPDGTTHQGYYYTDGCGNDEVFRASIAINGFHILDEPFGQTFMTWDQVKEIYDAGWGIINHGFSHCAYTCANYNKEVTDNVQIVKEKVGFEMTHFAIPSGDELGYTLPCFNNGMNVVYDQHHLLPGVDGLNVDTALNLFQIELHRNELEFEPVPYGDTLDVVADKSVDGNHFWYSQYGHRVGYPGDPFIFITAEDFIEYMDYLENTYGRYGDDRIWFAPNQEVYEYLQIRDSAKISNIEVVGNQLTFQLDLKDIPIFLQQRLVSMRVGGGSGISNIEVTNVEFTFNEEGLINLKW